MFGFGKALDVLRDGDAVTRNAWKPSEDLGPPQPHIQLMAKVVTHDHEDRNDDRERVMAPTLVSVVDVPHGVFIEPWMPTHADLLAEDWDYVRDDRQPHGSMQAAHWPESLPETVWCPDCSARRAVTGLSGPAVGPVVGLYLECGHRVDR